MRHLAASIAVLIFAGVALADEPAKLIVNGRTIKSDPAPIIRDGHVYVPLRVAGEAVGAEVTYDTKLKIVKLCARPPNYTLGNLNAACVIIDQGEGLTVKGRLFLGVRKLAESLGSKVKWDNQAKTVTITSAAPAL